MAHVGTITGSMVLDPSAYIAGLNRAAQHTANFQSSIQAGTAGVNAFGKASQSMAVGMSRLNGSVYAKHDRVLRPFPCREFFPRGL